MALSLTLASSFMASSVQAQRLDAGLNENSVMAASEHDLKYQGLMGMEWCEEANSVYHFVYDYAKYRCTTHLSCDYNEVLIRVQVGYEEHNLIRETSSSFRCSDCGYTEYN